jgi:hypothetical protein
MTGKPWYQSKTIWLNIISGIVAILTQANIIAILPPSKLPLVAAITAVANIVLRLITDTTIGVKP